MEISPSHLALSFESHLLNSSLFSDWIEEEVVMQGVSSSFSLSGLSRND